MSQNEITYPCYKKCADGGVLIIAYFPSGHYNKVLIVEDNDPIINWAGTWRSKNSWPFDILITDEQEIKSLDKKRFILQLINE